ncbi:MAG: hypothetical protein NTX25_16330 [Proteobacteria bacterium]|nr:hypothetical protein [Pseudomonadota bacterium]
MAGYFKTLWLIASTVLVLACSGKTRPGTTIGQAIDQFNPQFMELVELEGSQRFFSYDRYAKRLNFVEPGTQALSFSAILGDRGPERYWISGPHGKSLIDLSGKNVDVRIGDTSTRVLSLAGSIIAYTQDLEQGYFIFVDEFFSIALLQLGDDGAVLKKWIGGPILEGSFRILAGEIVSGGKFVLATTQSKLIVVDLAATLQNQAWSFQSIGQSQNDVSWMGRVPNRSDRILSYNGLDIRLISLTDAAVLDSKRIGSRVKVSKRGISHIGFFDGAGLPAVVYSQDGETLKVFVSPIAEDQLIFSYLQADSLVALSAKNKVYKLRLTDGLVEQSLDIDINGQIGLGAHSLVIVHDSPLGSIEILNLDQGDATTLSNFNLSVLQTQ